MNRCTSRSRPAPSVASSPGAVEDEEDVVVVVVELRALAEVLGVLERERVKAEQLLQLIELVAVGRGQVEPEEVVAVQVIADRRLIDLGEARHGEPKLIACLLRTRCLGLADGHRRLLMGSVGTCSTWTRTLIGSD